MKIKIVAAAVLILAVSFLVACSGEKTEPTTVPSTKRKTTAESTTLSVTATTVPVTRPIMQGEEIMMVKPSEDSAMPETTKKVTEPMVTVAGHVYSDTAVERIKGKYGVVISEYKNIYFQIVGGQRVDVGSEITNYYYNRSGYKATYEELLPAAKENRNKYSAYISEILKILNGYRAEKGLAPLKLNEKLTVMSCVRAEEIAWSGVQGHKRPDGRKCFSIYSEAGFDEGTAGENLGYGFWKPEEVCLAWKNSKTHYNNIIDPRFTTIGIGVAADPDEDGKLVWATHFLSE